MDITHDNVCSSMLSCFYSHLLSTGRPISSSNNYALLHNCAFSIDSYFPVNKFYNSVILSLLINAIIFVLICLVLVLYLYIFFLLDLIFST